MNWHSPPRAGSPLEPHVLREVHVLQLPAAAPGPARQACALQLAAAPGDGSVQLALALQHRCEAPLPRCQRGARAVLCLCLWGYVRQLARPGLRSLPLGFPQRCWQCWMAHPWTPRSPTCHDNMVVRHANPATQGLDKHLLKADSSRRHFGGDLTQVAHNLEHMH